MTSRDSSDRVFDSDEVAAILRAAAEIDQSASTSHALRPGLTLAQLQQIASEVGISPGAVEAASLALAAPSENPLSHRIQRVHRIAGAVPAAEWETLTHALRTVIGPRGNIRPVPGGLEIEIPGSEVGPARIGVRSVDGQTSISLWCETGKLRDAALTGSLLGVFASAGLAANAPGAAVLASMGVVGMGALFAGGLAVGLGVGVGIWRLGAAIWRRRVANLLSQVAVQVSAAVQEPECVLRGEP